MGQLSSYFHDSDALPSQSFPLKTSSTRAKLNLPCCNLSLLLLVLFTMHMENRLFPSALEQPLTYLKTVTSSLSSLYLAKDARSAAYNTNAIWTSNLLPLEKHSSFFSGQRTAGNYLMSSESKKIKFLFNGIKNWYCFCMETAPF